MAMMIRWPKPLHDLVDLLLPPACVGCDRPMPGERESFCASCAGRVLADVGKDYCPRCGANAEPYLTSTEGCPKCRARRSPIAGLARVGTYGGIVGDVVKRFKFTRQQRLDQVLGTMVADAIRSRAWHDELDALVPVPMDWRGWWQYRFNPAELIARSVGRSLRLPTWDVVRAQGNRRPQKDLPESERIDNIRGAFRMRRRARRVVGKCVCVIDDVCTSGATMREMGRVLKAAGAARVYGAVAARTQLGQGDLLMMPPAIPGT